MMQMKVWIIVGVGIKVLGDMLNLGGVAFDITDIGLRERGGGLFC